MAVISEWRREAQRVIDETLENFPDRMCAEDEAQIRGILRYKYPFGERAGHPYHMWLKCINEELRRRGILHKGDTDLPDPSFRILHAVMPESKGLSRRDWWLDLMCDYCTRIKAETRGCLMCRNKRDMLDELTQSDEWRVWIKAIRADPVDALIFADWLEDKGYTEIGGLFRTTPPPEPVLAELE